MTKAEVIRLLTALRKSELTKSACGKRLIAFYTQILNQQNLYKGDQNI